MLDVLDPRLNWYDAGRQHLWLPGNRSGDGAPPLAVVATHGSRIVLDDESELLDGTAAGWTACHGFNHPHIGMAVARQLERMPHIPLDGVLHQQAAQLAHRLARLLPGDLDHVAFAESGSAAVETALKMATQYWAVRGASVRRKFIAFKGAYHGETAGAMAVSDPATGSFAQFRKLVPRQFLVRPPLDAESIAAFEQTVAARAHQLAGIIIEPLVQSGGGMKFHDAALLRRVRASADRHDLLLIFDECFTGFGRTGSMFACEAAGVVPDIIALSKALTGGTMPLAATVAGRKVFDVLSSGDAASVPMHGPFAGSALACAAANASLDLFEHEPRLQQVAEIARRLEEGLAPCRELPGVRDVRVKGAIGVVEFRRLDDAAELRQRLIEAGVFLRPFGNVVSLTPALTIEPYDLSVLVGTVVKVLGESARRRRAGRNSAPDQSDLPL